MLSDEKRQVIDALPTDEMAYEISLGRRSRFQRDNFAYLESSYAQRMAQPISNNEAKQEDVHGKKDGKEQLSLVRIGEGLILSALTICLAYIAAHYLGLTP